MKLPEGYNPITMEDSIDIENWLFQTLDDNIVVFTDSKDRYSTLCLKKSYFLNTHMNDTYVECDIKNNSLIVEDTYKSKNVYRNIGYYLTGEYSLVDNKEFIKTLKKGRVFRVSKKKNKILAISREFLELSMIGLVDYLKNLKKKSEKDAAKINLPFKEQVYFENVMAEALYAYSQTYYNGINGYLRKGIDYLKELKPHSPNKIIYKNHSTYGSPDFKLDYDDFISYQNIIKKWGKNLSDAKKQELIVLYGIEEKMLDNLTDEKVDLLLKHMENKVQKNMEDDNIKAAETNIMNRINSIDKCHLEAAPRTNSSMVKNVYYRGMKGTYGHDKIGDQILIKNYTSISSLKSVAFEFWSNIKNCCIFAFHLPLGLPYINMINTTKYKNEREILLPRDIIFELFKITKHKYAGDPYDMYHMKVLPKTPEQFKVDTGCRNFDVVSITGYKKLKQLEDIPLSDNIKKENNKENVIPMVPENVSKNLSTKVPKLSKNCNDGFVCPLDKICNPQTGRCVGLSGKLGQSLQNQASAVKSTKKSEKNNETIFDTLASFKQDIQAAKAENTTKEKSNKKKTIKKTTSTKTTSSTKTVKKPTDGKTKTKKKNCNEGYKCPKSTSICNPESGRCVSLYGPTGKKLSEKEWYKKVHPVAEI